VNVAFFHSSLPEPGRKLGGVEVFVHRLACRLTERGHTVRMCSFSPRPEGAPYDFVRAGSRWLGTSQSARLGLAPLVINRLSTGPADVLHLHGDDWFYVNRRLPTVRTFYGSAYHEARTATSVRRRCATALVYPLELLASRLATASFDIGTRLPHGYRLHGSLSLAVDAAAERTPAPRTEHPTVLFVGTWRGRKRGEFLADLFTREVRTRHPTAELLMVSDACEERPGVRWIGFPTDEQLRSLYGASWLLCAPSTYEGFGLPYLEAMHHGLPVVATPNPGARHVLGDAASRLAGDGELGDALCDLIADGRERARLAEAGLRRAATFSWDRVLDEHERAYELAVTSFRSR